MTLFLLVVLTLSRVHQHFDVLAAVRPALGLAGLAVLFAVTRPHRLEPASLLRGWPARVMLALGVVASLSAPFGLSFGHSASFILTSYAKVLVVAFLLVAALREPRDLSYFVWAVVLSAGLLAWMSVFVFDVQSVPGEGGAWRLNDLYTYDANDMGCVLAAALPLGILAFETSGPKGKALAVLVLVGIGAALARSGSRGGFVGLAAVLLALVVWVRRVSVGKRLAFLVVVVGGVLLAAPEGYWDRMSSLSEPTEDYNWSAPQGRKALAARGLGYMLRFPVTGVGIDNFPRAEGTISELARSYVPRTGERVLWSAPHNSYVQVGAELGIPGLLLWLALVLGGIFGMRRLQRRLPDGWPRGDPEERFLYLSTLYLPVAMVGFAVTAAFVSFAYMDVLYVLAALVGGCHLSCLRRLREADDGPQGRGARERKSPARSPGATWEPGRGPVVRTGPGPILLPPGGSRVRGGRER